MDNDKGKGASWLDEPFLPAKSPVAQNWVDKKAVAKSAELKAGQDAGIAEKQKGMAAGALLHADILTAAQSVARKLAVNGPVTIDDVVQEMRSSGFKESDIAAGGKVAKNWKGSVFSEADWVCVGSITSREPSAHGRQVRQWATKLWLRLHPVNGTQNEASAFHLYRLYNEALHCYPAGTDLVFILGKDMLDASLVELSYVKGPKYRADGTVECEAAKTLYGCPVFPVAGVGAICLPREMLEHQLRTVSTINGFTDI